MKINNVVRYLSVTALFALLSSSAFAGATTGLPWEAPLTVVQNSLKGPVAMSISLIAVVILGAMLIFNGELGDFAKKAIMVCLAIALLVASDSVISTLFSTAGALLF
jgi:type IV secretion system protein VirB2